MHLPALQNQHGAYFRTEAEKQNCFLFLDYGNLFFYVLPFKLICLDSGKIQWVAHNPIPMVENIDSKTFLRKPVYNKFRKQQRNPID